MKNEFSDVIERHKNNSQIHKASKLACHNSQLNMNQSDVSQDDDKRIGKIWTCWWQGEDNAPPLVKKCLESIRKNAGNHEVIVIDRDNISTYVEIPVHIHEKHEAKYIITTFFTEVVRMALLNKYGGLWLDATVFCFRQIPDEIWEMPLYTAKYYNKQDHPGHIDKKDIYLQHWAGNMIGGRKGHPLFGFSLDMMTRYWKKYRSLIVFFMYETTFRLAYDTIDTVKQDINAIPVNGNDRFVLRNIFNEAYIQGKIDALIASETLFFKLCWKAKFKECTRKGEETVYKRFLDGALT